ncbi:hypothetical protein N8312_01840 [bacterium]|nr:hypothetical protein [bacterium]
MYVLSNVRRIQIQLLQIFIKQMHSINTIHIYNLTIETDAPDAVKARISFFLPNWKVSYCQVARNTTATLIYAASKLDAEPIFFRGSLDEQC